jgi:excisionase family DNA binding protein
MTAIATRSVMTISEAAAALGVHPDTIRKAEREGRIPPIRRESFGSDDRIFLPEDVEALKRIFFR